MRLDILIEIGSLTIKNTLRQDSRISSYARNTLLQSEQGIVNILKVFTCNVIVEENAKGILRLVSNTNTEIYWSDIITGSLLHYGKGSRINAYFIKEFQTLLFFQMMKENKRFEKIILLALKSAAIVFSYAFPQDIFSKCTLVASDIAIINREKQFDTTEYALANMFNQEDEIVSNRITAFCFYFLSAKHYHAVVAVAPLNT